MDLLLAFSHVLSFLLVALALPLPSRPLRQLASANLLVGAAIGLYAGFADEGMRELITTHSYAGYEGKSVEISMVAFPTGTRQAEAWLWPLPFAGFALLWSAVLVALGRRRAENPWLLPLLLAWTALATWLAMQMLAAPAAVVQPAGLDRFLWPAGLALALLAARRAKGLLRLFVMVGGGIMLARLPVALFSYYASEAQLGTSLDVHLVRDIVNPMSRTQFDPRLTPGSGEQYFWLIWLEHVIFFPAIYFMSLFGVAFGVHLFHKHGPAQQGAPQPTPATS